VNDNNSPINLPLDIIREAGALEHERKDFSPAARANANFAYLYSLILSDTDFEPIWGELKKLSGHRFVAKEDVPRLANHVQRYAGIIGADARLLAICLICWANEAELHPFETRGSADWFSLPVDIQNTRVEIREEATELSREIIQALSGAGLDPEAAVRVCIEKTKHLSSTLRHLEKTLQGMSYRKSGLLQDVRKYQLEAYYLKRIRKKRIGEAAFRRLLYLAGTDPDEISKDKTRRHKAQQAFYDWSKAAERKIEPLIAVWSSEST
jgi:hypothetical protein